MQGGEGEGGGGVRGRWCSWGAGGKKLGTVGKGGGGCQGGRCRQGEETGSPEAGGRAGGLEISRGRRTGRPGGGGIHEGGGCPGQGGCYRQGVQGPDLCLHCHVPGNPDQPPGGGGPRQQLGGDQLWDPWRGQDCGCCGEGRIRAGSSSASTLPSVSQ